ncbi:helix-turn-helix transcriptional regulator [Nesterenkonia sp. NBAIMH1]|uniref:helix-turn-helix transcriptional regulator n=1 Tax=Nesterenkonia sp. NBAIMH1 TaxID=2600320 RepID=UPI0011B4CFEA|nr:helix-turn-helix transcriptional regulator [Nesterenkonia sp. NBAIMH1]
MRALQPMVAVLARNPADERSLKGWSETLHLSERTINRALLDDIGMTFAPWRRLLRIDRARSLIADGESVSTTSWRVGYASPSAFISAYRQVVGETPGGRGAMTGGRDRVSTLQHI